MFESPRRMKPERWWKEDMEDAGEASTLSASLINVGKKWEGKKIQI